MLNMYSYHHHHLPSSGDYGYYDYNANANTSAKAAYGSDILLAMTTSCAAVSPMVPHVISSVLLQLTTRCANENNRGYTRLMYLPRFPLRTRSRPRTNLHTMDMSMSRRLDLFLTRLTICYRHSQDRSILLSGEPSCFDLRHSVLDLTRIR